MSQSVRPINDEILGMSSPNNLIRQIIPAKSIINVAAFRAGDPNDVLSFITAPQTTGRLGIFAAEKDGIERGVMMFLPSGGRPDRVLICIMHNFDQAHEELDPLGWTKPLSVPYLKFLLLKHIINRWGAQLLAARSNTAMMYIVRAKATDQLGPFARDGQFLDFVLGEIAMLTNGAFSYDICEAFTFSSGIFEFNRFIGPAAGAVDIRTVYSIDPTNSTLIAAPKDARRKQYASGAAGPILLGFEPLPFQRWANEDEFYTHPKPDPKDKNYLHNTVMPHYALYLGLATP